MAIATLMLDKRNKTAKKFPLVIRISHKQIPKNIQTGFKINESDWDDINVKLRKSFPNSTRANATIDFKKAIAQKVISDLNQNDLKILDVYQIVERILIEIKKAENKDSEIIQPKRTCFFVYGEQTIERLKAAKRDGYAMSIQHSINSFKSYVNKQELYFSDINLKFIKDYEAYCQGKGNTVNTIGVHLRNVRTLFNQAIKDESLEVNQSMYPFGQGGYSIKKSKTKKRAVKESVIDQIRKLDLKEGSTIWHHRNFFLFMFNLRGMNFIDFCYLKKKNISGDRVKYKRSKTKIEFDIKLTEESNRILNYYIKNKNAGELIFPVMDDLKDEEDTFYLRKKYQERLKTHNKYLKKIAKEAGTDIKLTTYVARHSFATIGLHKGLSKSLIGDMLGHADYNVTETYFAEFDQEALDNAAETVFK
jgi:integrase/recombinase XerD